MRDFLLRLRGKSKQCTAYIRFESDPGRQMQIDWGHFGSLEYHGDRRKRYALVVIEAFSRIAQCFRQSKLNKKLTIDQFDFNHHSSREQQKTRILNLMSLEFLKEKMDIILIGNPGVGKSILAKAAAYAATQAGKKVLFTTAMDRINHLIAADADHSLLKKRHYYKSPELLPHRV